MRTPSVAGGRPVVVAVRLSTAEAKRLDALRKGFDRSTYLRMILATHHLQAITRHGGEES